MFSSSPPRSIFFELNWILTRKKNWTSWNYCPNCSTLLCRFWINNKKKSSTNSGIAWWHRLRTVANGWPSTETTRRVRSAGKCESCQWTVFANIRFGCRKKWSCRKHTSSSEHIVLSRWMAVQSKNYQARWANVIDGRKNLRAIFANVGSLVSHKFNLFYLDSFMKKQKKVEVLLMLI